MQNDPNNYPILANFYPNFIYFSKNIWLHQKNVVSLQPKNYHINPNEL